MRLAVADASVVVKWCTWEEDSDQAEKLLQSGLAFHAPELLRLELANAIWKKTIREEIPQDLLLASEQDLERTITQWHDNRAFIGAAFQQACSMHHPIYDFIYLELAKSLGAPLITSDRKFAAKAGDASVVLLQDWTG